MSVHRVEFEPAFVLHSRPFRNTSLIVDLFSRHHGRLSAVANSARGLKSRYRGRLQLFMPLLVSWSGKQELKTLGQVEFGASPNLLDGNALLCGFYLNELLTRLMQCGDPHPYLFDHYENTLKKLYGASDFAPILRYFEKQLLERMGYGLPLVVDAHSGSPIEANLHYQYLPERGFVRCDDPSTRALTIIGQSLLDIAADNYQCAQTCRDAKRLLRMILARHLGGKPLKTRDLFVGS